MKSPRSAVTPLAFAAIGLLSSFGALAQTGCPAGMTPSTHPATGTPYCMGIPMAASGASRAAAITPAPQHFSAPQPLGSPLRKAPTPTPAHQPQQPEAYSAPEANAPSSNTGDLKPVHTEYIVDCATSAAQKLIQANPTPDPGLFPFEGYQRQRMGTVNAVIHNGYVNDWLIDGGVSGFGGAIMLRTDLVDAEGRVVSTSSDGPLKVGFCQQLGDYKLGEEWQPAR